MTKPRVCVVSTPTTSNLLYAGKWKLSVGQTTTPRMTTTKVTKLAKGLAVRERTVHWYCFHSVVSIQ